jgi:hypothetical protein
VSQIRLRQVARLEKLAQPYIERRRQTEKEWQWTRQGAAAHAAILAFLIRYGKPTIDEPLSCAWQRCSETSAWKECCDRFSSIIVRAPEDTEYPFEPNNRFRTLMYGMPLRHVIIASFPGVGEKDKLDAVFASAPPWLIWFTFGDYTAELLGLTLPNLSTVTGFARSKADFDRWFGLPSGAFERQPWPDGPDKEPLARTDLKLLRPDLEGPDSQMTPRECKRARATYMKSYPIECTNDWPILDPPESLRMPTELRAKVLDDIRFKAAQAAYRAALQRKFRHRRSDTP